jgi:hypothetical protein
MVSPRPSFRRLQRIVVMGRERLDRARYIDLTLRPGPGLFRQLHSERVRLAEAVPEGGSRTWCEVGTVFVMMTSAPA